MTEPVQLEIGQIARDLRMGPDQVAAVVGLLDDGNTVPFITRYRRESTRGLDEEQIRRIQSRARQLRQVAERAAAITRLIEAQGRLTPELREEIARADTLKRLEDLYLPYRPKRRSRATAARERGLGPLAEAIWEERIDADELPARAAACAEADEQLPDAAAAIAGAMDILAEQIGENADVRSVCRDVARRSGRLSAARHPKCSDEAQREFRGYFDYAERIDRIPPHRILALNRGESLAALRVRFLWDDEAAHRRTVGALGLGRHRFATQLHECVVDALQRLIQPSLERELRRDLTEKAERHAVEVFARNLRNLLLQPPVTGQRVLAIDPGFRTGCKLAVLDEVGELLANDVAYVTGSAEKRQASKQKLAELLQTHDCRLVAIGNGTACRETEELVAETISELVPEARYLIVNEAGASIYSTSTIAREEFPELDATVRGTISIGRRLLDPLSELVKIDPQHIGVGMYQHDVSPKLLKESLAEVIESCVNFVGVDLNTASAALLRHVSGFNQLIARRIVEHRSRKGPFRNRRQLLDVPGVGEATFTQAAGFLKIGGGAEPLDSTWIHPESYDLAGRVLAEIDVAAEQLLGSAAAAVRERLAAVDVAQLAAALGTGELLLRDILEALSRPGRDPRADLPGPVFRVGILKLDDLHPGLELQGTVLNVVDFGAFVDVGLKDSAFVHVSQLATRYVKDPHEVVAVGDVVTAWVLNVDRERSRVGLTMIRPAEQREPTPPAERSLENKERRDSPDEARAERPVQPASAEPLRGFDELKRAWRDREQ